MSALILLSLRLFVAVTIKIHLPRQREVFQSQAYEKTAPMGAVFFVFVAEHLDGV
jgi:hypothetical protein